MKMERFDRGIKLFDDQTEIGKITFTPKADAWTVDSTYVNSDYRGQNLGTPLVDELVSWAEEEGVKLDPVCPYVVKKFDEEPEKYGAIDAR